MLHFVMFFLSLSSWDEGTDSYTLLLWDVLLKEAETGPTRCGRVPGAQSPVG